MKHELYLIPNAHENTAFDSDFENVDWEFDENAEICGEFDSLESAIQAADDEGIGIYFVLPVGSRRSYVVRVVHGAKPDVREL